MADRVRHEVEAKPLSKNRHLRHRNHVTPAAAQHDDMGVVNHDPLRRAPHITQRLGEKHLAIEPLERRIALKKQHPRVTQHRRSRLHLALLPPPAPPHAEKCRAEALCPEESPGGPAVRAAGIRSRAAGKRPSTPHTTTVRHPPSVPHGLARDSPCSDRTAPRSVAGRARLSPGAATPARWRSSSAGPGVPSPAKLPVSALSRVSPLPVCAVPESWCVALGSTCGVCSGRSF